ncbi:serine hydrolase [Paraburkholderia sp. A1RI-2L]|uniref:serine hydrolase domain-containing protein n=1 Tax=Paraburkholderia sp. A1RI-2L TaxID=3028367 RepID=UPI003B8289DD
MKNSDSWNPIGNIDATLGIAGRRQFLSYTGAGILAALLPACSGSSTGNAYSHTIAWGRQQCEAALTGKVAALSVALMKGNRIVWQQAFGNASANTPAMNQTRFNIGSVSKVVAALAAMILQDRGLLDLDTPIAKYLPSFSMLSPHYTRITTRHLLSHSSGLGGQNNWNIFTGGVAMPGYVENTLTALANEHLKYPPGEMANYCNDGFTLVDPVVAAVSGQSYVEFVQHNILTPLNMSNSCFLASAPTTGTFAMPYGINGAWYPQEFSNVYASGGLCSTPGDMMNFAQMLLDGGAFQGRQIVSPAAIAEMGRDQTTKLHVNPTPVYSFGLGWDWVKSSALAYAGNTTWIKDGETPAFSSMFIVLPDAQLAVMLTGHTGYNPFALAYGLVEQAMQEDGSIRASAPLLGAVVPPVATAPDVTTAAGMYGNHSAPIHVQVGTDGSLVLNRYAGTGTGNSMWQPLDDGVTKYEYRSDGWWWSDNTGHSYSFNIQSGTDLDGQPFSYRYLVQRTSGSSTLGGDVIAQQLTAQSLPLSSAWQARLNSTWVPTNLTSTDEITALRGAATWHTTIGSLSEFEGYILFGGNDPWGYQLLTPLADDRGGVSVRAPNEAGRELNEISFSVAADGSETMTVGGLQFVRVPV